MAAYPKCPMCGATGPIGSAHTHCACVFNAVLTAYIKPPEEIISMMNTLPITIVVPLERAVNLLVGLFENGYSGEWLLKCERLSPFNREEEDGPWYACEEYWMRGGSMELTVDNPKVEGTLKKIFARTSFGDALALMAKDNPYQFGELLRENDDAITADVFGQYLVYQEIVYG